MPISILKYAGYLQLLFGSYQCEFQGVERVQVFLYLVVSDMLLGHFTEMVYVGAAWLLLADQAAGRRVVETLTVYLRCVS